MKFPSINTLHLQQISMAENSRSQICFWIWRLLHFSTLIISAASYSIPDHYFINCGSSSAVTVYGGQRQFVPDDFFFSGGTTRAEDSNYNLTSSQDHSLYGTARVILKPSHYEFSLKESGIYVVRLHFFPFTYDAGNLSDARFSVFYSKFKLLSNHTFTSESRSDLPLVEEFFINVGDGAGKLRIDFVPDEGKHRSFAFINAIEAFLAPPRFLPDSAPRVSPEAAKFDNYDGVLKSPLRVVRRINVGGGIVTRDTDKIFRYWVPDDAYLLIDKTARNTTYSGKIEYHSGAATVDDAPESVYKTAKNMNVVDDANAANIFNITWLFDVGKGARHLVRLHFCDIVSQTSNEGLIFNLYIYKNSRFQIRPATVMQQLAVPFYVDYVVYSDDSGFMNISIGPNQESQFHTAFLNGVEIMEMVRDRRSSVPGGGDYVRKRLFKVVCWGVAVVILVAVIMTVSIICLRKKKWRPIEEVSEWAFVHIRGGTSHHSKTSRTSVRTATGSVHADLNLGLRVPLSAILFATRKFNPKLMIGEGGFGKVYKGRMRDGRKVAVKRSEAGRGQGLQEFHTEINVLSKIRHQHLVSLIGYCDERNEMILVYEFMEKGSLRDHLYSSHGEASSPPFSWEQRLKICIGAARGLHYLHTGSKDTIVHRDIKSTNILLDEDYVAKVADFGLSRSGSLEQSHFSTEVKGSFGYLDPEYYTTLQLSKKSDVYSFGVVLLEVVCGRTAVDRTLPGEQVNLADWGVSWQRKGQLECIVDPSLAGKIDPNSLRVFGETVERCLQEFGGDRPDMSDVLWCLEYSLQFQMSGFPRQVDDGSTTDVSLGLPTTVVRRLPSDSMSMSISEDEVAFRYCSFSDASEVGSGVVFSQLKNDSAR